MKGKLLSILCAVCTALCVLTGAIAVPLLVRPFHSLHIGPMGLEAASGLTRQQIREAYAAVCGGSVIKGMIVFHSENQ